MRHLDRVSVNRIDECKTVLFKLYMSSKSYNSEGPCKDAVRLRQVYSNRRG